MKFREILPLGWSGKMIGGFVGLYLGGPLGAIAGAAFGHMFDNEKERSGPGGSITGGHADPNVVFFVAAFSMMAKVAASDGGVTPGELKMIKDFMANDLKTDPESMVVAERIFDSAIDDPHSVEDYASQFYTCFHDKKEILVFMIDMLVRLAMADGKTSSQKESLIRTVPDIFNLGPAEYEAILKRHGFVSSVYYELLGCSRDDPDEVIKSKYREMVKEFHPDTIAGKGLPKPFVRFAEEKFREIHAAYEEICRSRGIK